MTDCEVARPRRIDRASTAPPRLALAVAARGLCAPLDVGGDRTVLLVPNGTRDGLVALRVDGESVERSTVIPLGGTLTSNLVALDGERSVETPTLATGTENGLRLWIPS